MDLITIILVLLVLVGVAIAAGGFIIPRLKRANPPTEVESLFSIRREPNVLIVQPVAPVQVDEARIKVLGRQLADLFAATPDKQILIDMSRVEHVSSAKLGTLVILNDSLKPTGRRLHLAAVSPTILKLLSITKLDQMLRIFPTVEAAMAELATTPPPTTKG